MPLADSLLRLGLAPKEAAVYVALLELGTASVQAVARRAGVVRPTTYVILEHLAQKGLVAKATGPDAKKMLFRAEDPARLSSFLEEQRRSIERLQREAEHLVPELRSAYARGEERPRVRLFEGKEGLHELQKEFVAVSREPMAGMILCDDVQKLFTGEEYNEKIRSIRVRQGIFSRSIEVTDQPNPSIKHEDAQVLRETRYLPKSVLPLKASFAVHGPLLSVVSLRGKVIGVLINHQDIADSFQALHDLVWKFAEGYQRVSASAERVSTVSDPS